MLSPPGSGDTETNETLSLPPRKLTGLWEGHLLGGLSVMEGSRGPGQAP